MKQAKDKSTYIISLDEVQKQAELICGNNARIMITSRASKRVLIGKELERGFLKDLKVFYILI